MNTAVIIVIGLLLGYPIYAFADTIPSRTDGDVFPLPDAAQNIVPTVGLLQASMRQAFVNLKQLQPGQGGFQPLTTRLLHVCQHVNAQHVSTAHLTVPLFVVGDDAYSLSWLTHYAPILKKVQAVGLIVSASSQSALKRISDAAKGVRLYPVNGDALSTRFGLTCYPVLISHNIIEQ